MVSKTWIAGTDNWTDDSAWAPTGEPGAGDNVTISTGQAQITSNVPSIGTLTLSDSGGLVVDPNDSTGGSHLAVTGVLTNSSYLQIGPGNGSLTAADGLSVGSLSNLPNGRITLVGGAAYASLTVAGTAGFGTGPGFLTGQVHLYGRASVAFGSGRISTISGSADLLLSGDKASLSNGGGYNSALTQLQFVTGDLELQNGATITTTTAINNTGQIQLDDTNAVGGSSLVVGGKLTNSGFVAIGPGNSSLTQSDSIKATGIDQVSSGVLKLVGLIGAPGKASNYASLVLSGAAGFGTTGVLSGQVLLYQASSIAFASGQITTIGGGSDLLLNGTRASISNGGGYNSALQTLKTVAGDLELQNGAAITTTGALNNTGAIQLDDTNAVGGSSLSIDGKLTSSGTINIGPGNASLTASDAIHATSLSQAAGAALNIVGHTGAPGNPSYYASLVLDSAAGFGTAGVLTGQVHMYEAAAITFTSGQITTIGGGSDLLLNGTRASITNGGGYNSALQTLKTVAGDLELQNGAAITTTGALNNTGAIQLDDTNAVGGSSLLIDGKLTSSGTINIGPGNASLTAADTVHATSLSQAVGAALNIVGHIGTPGNPTYYASLVLDSAAGFGTAGVLTGQVHMYEASAITFASGQITTIKSGSDLLLNGTRATIGTGGGYNSALQQIQSVAGDLELQNGAKITTTGALNNTGAIQLDDTNAVGGSSLTIAGKLTSSGTINIGPGNSSLTAADTIHVSSLSQTTGATLNINGHIGSAGNPTFYASLVVDGAAGFGTAGVLTGQVHLYAASDISFDRGQITSISGGSDLLLNGTRATISNGNGYNSALTSLSSIAGTLELQNGAKITSAGALTNSGNLLIDDINGGGGTSITISGRLTNSGTVEVGPGNSSLTSTDFLKSSGFGNSGTVNIGGSADATAILSTSVTNTGTINGNDARITGPVVNNGSLQVFGGDFTITGALTGSGQATINNGATLDLAAASSGDVTFASGTLDLAKSAGYTGSVSGFGGSDVLDLSDIAFRSQTPRYAENKAKNGGTLTITDGTDTARIAFLGNYTASNFQFSSDGSGGTDVTFVAGPTAPRADHVGMGQALFDAAFGGSGTDSAFSPASHAAHTGAAALFASAMGGAHAH